MVIVLQWLDPLTVNQGTRGLFSQLAIQSSTNPKRRMSDMKICTKCGQEKDEDQFSPRKRGLMSWCKGCVNKHQNDKYKNDPSLRDKRVIENSARRKRLQEERPKPMLPCPNCSKLFHTQGDIDIHLSKPPSVSGCKRKDFRKKSEKLTGFEAQLGQTVSSAMHELKKQLMFGMLVELGRDVCYRCGGKLRVDDFSVEHKEPWRGVDNSLFWDHNNIGFSHLSCNSRANRGSKIVLPEGQGWCSDCKKFLPLDDFSPSKRKSGICKKCRNTRRYGDGSLIGKALDCESSDMGDRSSSVTPK